jgi:membrane peptidoglycan carboxypeptidase
MRNSLARRQRHRRQGARRQRGGNVVRGTLVAIPILLFGLLLVAGAGAALAAVGTYQLLSQNLPDPAQALDALTFTSQTVVYDRTGNTELAKLGSDRRNVVQFKDIPDGLIDATTSIEDKTFWENSGFDPLAFVKATMDTISGNDRGASTITQQLVRARLLPQDVLDGDRYIRKAKEIIQSIRLTQAYPGTTGKQTIMQDYLNQNFYGNRSYGVAAAAMGYWHKDLKDLTLAQMAILAGIPQSPTEFDLVRNAEEQTVKGADGKETTELVVPPDRPVVQRRNYILELMLTNSRLGNYTPDEIAAAQAEPVILADQSTPGWLAPQFVWQVRDELGQLICGSVQCEKIDTGGYQVYTTLNYGMQKTVEKWLYAAAVVPNSTKQASRLRALKIPSSEWSWIRDLSARNIHNDAAGVVDYRTGEVLAYAGSASYTAKGNKKFQPQFDVLGDGFRQPGSSIKPIDYAIGIDDKTLTASTMFMDVVTNFATGGAPPYLPTQADHAERGPVRLRNALQFSLNIPAIKAGFMIGLDHEFQRTKDFGLVYPAHTSAVPSQSIGTLLVHPIDMISAYGAIADGGVLMPRHTILKVIGPDGEQVWPPVGVRRDRRRRRAHAAPHDPEGDRPRRRAGLAAGRREPHRQAGGVQAGRLRGHGHPRRQHPAQDQPVLGQVAHHRRRDQLAWPPGRLQDRHHERQPRRACVRVPRAAVRSEAPWPGRRGVDGQLRQLPQRRQALARDVRAALVGHPLGHLEGHADRELQPGQTLGSRHGHR